MNVCGGCSTLQSEKRLKFGLATLSWKAGFHTWQILSLSLHICKIEELILMSQDVIRLKRDHVR